MNGLCISNLPFLSKLRKRTVLANLKNTSPPTTSLTKFSMDLEKNSANSWVLFVLFFLNLTAAFYIVHHVYTNSETKNLGQGSWTQCYIGFGHIFVNTNNSSPWVITGQQLNCISVLPTFLLYAYFHLARSSNIIGLQFHCYANDTQIYIG